MPSYDTRALEQSIHTLVNEERSNADRELLSWSDDLAELSRTHSTDMVERSFFSHHNPDGESPHDRADRLDISCSSIVDDPSSRTGLGENIFNASAYHTRRTQRRGEEETVTYDWKDEDELATEIVDGWMNSEGHRRNILNDTYQTQGLGVDISNERRILITQTFC